MTRQLIFVLVFATLSLVQASRANGQFDLTEPPQDSESLPAAQQKPEVLPGSRELNRPERTGRKQSPEGAPATGNSSSHAAAAVEKKNASGSNLPRRQQVPVFELLNEDVEPPDFFSGPVPRTKPIGEDASLNDVCSDGNRCWAVGERGVVCISEDGGQSWTTSLTPMECSLRSVCFLNSQAGWIAGIRIIPNTSQEMAVLLHTRDGGRTWQDVGGGASSGSGAGSVATASLPGIRHVQYFGLEEAIAITLPLQSRGGHGIFRSGDGGRTWTVIATEGRGGRWNAAQFLSASEGIVAGSHQSYAAVVSNQAVVINPSQPSLREMRGVSLNQNGEGWIVGDGATVLTTGNAGVTWKPPIKEIPSQLAEVIDLHAVAHSGSTVLAAGNPGSFVLRSGSGGADWTLLEVPLCGRINRIRFLSETEVLAVGSLGQILRSTDSGVTWEPVRSSKFRSGVLNFVTDADRPSLQLLAEVSGDNGVRSAVLQISQPLDDSGAPSDAEPSAMSERSQLALTQIGVNDTGSDWMFPRTRPEHHLSADQLIAEWNRQTDGRLRRLLPLRLARDIRNWRPTVIVIEPTSDNDAVAAILRDVIALAARLAAEDEQDSRLLSQIGLHPWTVERVVSRVPADRRATLSFDDADLLTSLGTTTGLLCDAVTRFHSDGLKTGDPVRPRSGYEIVFDRSETPAVQSLIAGLEPNLTSAARRPVHRRSRELIESLRKTIQTAHLEASALSGQSRLTGSSDSLIGELQKIGENLPEALALKQLKDLANLHLQQNSMESYLAIQQEVTRRFPASEDARIAAGMLFLFYSSAETRHYRIRSMFRSPASAAAGSNALPGSSSGQDQIPALVAQPKIQTAEVQALSATPGNQLSMLKERWDSHAATAMQIVLSDGSTQFNHREINPLVRLRQAANLRIRNLSGEQLNLLAEVSQRDDPPGLFAKSEMQAATPASTPVLPLFNIPRRSDRPFLDGKLAEEIWEAAEEISLVPFVRNTASPDSAAFIQKPGPGETVVSSLVMVSWDEQFLYLAARLERPPQKVRSVQLATHRTHDADHRDRDRLELEIDTDRDFSTSFRLAIDESGLTSDRCWMLDKWNPEWFVAVDSDDTTWRLEAAIPLAELSAPTARPGDLWSIRLRRIFPGILQHELLSTGSPVSTGGTGLVRFIRPRVVTRSPSQK